MLHAELLQDWDLNPNQCSPLGLTAQQGDRIGRRTYGHPSGKSSDYRLLFRDGVTHLWNVDPEPNRKAGFKRRPREIGVCSDFRIDQPQLMAVPLTIRMVEVQLQQASVSSELA